jgi:hypothetical protein
VKKIPTIFVRDLSKQPSLVTPEWKAGCEWIRDGDGVATLKHDGSCCLVRDGKLYKRRELKQGQPAPPNFERADFDEETGKTVGWVPVLDGLPDDKYHMEAWSKTGGEYPNGTYELMGPKVQGNKEQLPSHVLLPHGAVTVGSVPRSYDELRIYFSEKLIEGIVWHHPDGRAGKIKRKDFGFRW